MASAVMSSRLAGADHATAWLPRREEDVDAENCRTANLQGLRLHDLRHTYASVLAGAGFSLPLIGALLGHTQSQTTARYSHLADDPLRAATERAGAIVTGNGDGKHTAADVIALIERR